MKRCNSIAFASSFEHLPIKFSDKELSNSIFISDKPNPNYSFTKKSITIEDMPEGRIANLQQYIDTFEQMTKTNEVVSMQTTTNIPTFIVELAREVNRTVKVPTCNDDIDRIAIEDWDYSDFVTDYFNTDDARDPIALSTIDGYKDAFINFIDNRDYFEDHSLSPKFLDWIKYIYHLLSSGELQIDVLKLLNNNGVQTVNLEKANPIDYEEKEITDVEPIGLFNDIKIVIDKEDTNTSSKSALYKPDREGLKKATLGNSTQLEAFSKNKFTVIHTKKSANIDDSQTYHRNHDILHSLARNGVVCSPDTGAELSLSKLVNKLKTYEKFNIVFIHPSYELKVTRGDYPSELVEPSYTINSGELLAIVYRYISINFFGYCSVFTEGMEELEYLI